MLGSSPIDLWQDDVEALSSRQRPRAISGSALMIFGYARTAGGGMWRPISYWRLLAT